VQLSTEVAPAELPQPKNIKEVSKHANSLRDKAIILVGWASGCRIGEVFETKWDKDYLTWKDITFEDDKAWINLDGKTGGKRNTD
ncbi:MAG: hypothetical protein V5A72_02695, partial [Candidatus Nanohaloarchaea archaeon]